MLWEDTLWVLSKSFTKSDDPLLIVWDPYTQEQTEKSQSFCLESPLRHNPEIYLINMISPNMHVVINIKIRSRAWLHFHYWIGFYKLICKITLAKLNTNAAVLASEVYAFKMLISSMLFELMTTLLHLKDPASNYHSAQLLELIGSIDLILLYKLMHIGA